MVTAPTEHWTKIVLNPGPPNLRSKGRLSLCLWLAASTTVIPGWLPKVRAAPLPLHRSSQAPCELPPTRSRRPNSQRRPIVPHAHCSSAGSCRRSTPANLLPPCYRVSATHNGDDDLLAHQRPAERCANATEIDALVRRPIGGASMLGLHN